MAWHALFPSCELSEGGVKLHPTGKREIGVFRHRGKLYAVLNFCPHAGAPICGGEIDHPIFVDQPGGDAKRDFENPTLRCPWHHWEFDLKNGKSLCPISPRIKTYAVREREGQIEVDL